MHRRLTDCSLHVQVVAQNGIEAVFGIRLSAPAGSKAARVIDRGFKATAETVNGAEVYVGVGDSSHSLWRDASGKWTIGEASEKGQEGGIAHVTNGESPLSQSAEWRVHIPQGLFGQWVTESRVSEP